MIRLTKERVEQVFADAAEQADYLIGLYKLIYPDWDDIEAIDGHPSCNDWTWKAICRLAMDFDKTRHEDCMAGGMWLNRGFSTAYGEKLPNWCVSTKGCTVTYKAKELVA